MCRRKSHAEARRGDQRGWESWGWLLNYYIYQIGQKFVIAHLTFEL